MYNKPTLRPNNEKVRGKKTFQPKRINWSYLYRGSEARTQTNKDRKNKTLAKYQTKPKSKKLQEKSNQLNGGNQPPKKNKTFKFDNNTILRYSPKKKKAKGKAECSVL